MRAFLFPGQASQFVGMGRDLAAWTDDSRALFDRADEIMGVGLSRICFEGPEEELTQTRYTQPAIFVHSVAVSRLLPVRPAAAAGHSLGEYSALVVAGALTFEDGLRLVQRRGELMQEAGTRSPGTMAAVIGADADVVAAVCAEVSSEEIVQPANFNSPGQIVISGSEAGVERAMAALRERGARMVKRLPVSGAFHSPLMEYARVELGAVLDGVPLRDATFPVYANVTGLPVTRAEEIRGLLLRQVTSPVLWEASIRALRADGATAFVEVGPGTVLQGLCKRIDPETPCVSVGTRADIEAFIADGRKG